MDRKYLLFDNPKQCIVIMVLFIMAVGGINVFSATFVNKASYGFLIRYLAFSIVGVIAMFVTKRIGYKKLLKSEYLMPIFWVTLASLVFIQFAGHRINGAARWIFLGPISIQPSEFSKLLGIMLCASLLGSRMDKGRKISLFQWPSSKAFWMMAVQAAFILKQPDMGTMSIIMALVLAMFILAGVDTKKVYMIIGGAALCAVAAVIISPYRLDRVKNWIDPFSDPLGNGYQMVQSLIAIGSGGWTGMEWGQGIGKYWYLPEAHTDFAFAIFCQENGFLGALALITAYVIIAFAFIRVCREVKDSKAFLLAYGVTFLIIGQAAANMCMVTGLLPVIGVPLPFISYGGSSMAVSMIAIGLFLSIYDEELSNQRLESMTPEERREGIHVYQGGWQR